MFNSRPKMEDERICAQNNKIFASTGRLTLSLLFLSILIKSCFLDMPFASYGTEVGIFLIAGIYLTVRASLTGSLDMGFKGKGGKKRLIRAVFLSLLGGILFGTVIAFINFFKYGFPVSDLPIIIIPLALQFMLLIFGVTWITDRVSHKQNEKIDSETEEDE